ncbi:MAG: multicopper oxidase domain-containing protein [Nitrosomonas sp.]|nr:multicopper oxidase domain-containing protein [Nitrosomonas sp.]
MKPIVFGLEKKTIAAFISLFITLFFSQIILAATHTISLSAETLPNGQFAYQMGTNSFAGQQFPADATIPGPTLFIQQGDTVNITLTNNTTSVPVGINIPGVLEGAAEAAPNGGSQSYSFTANQSGTFPYHDNGSALLGLFGALVVDNTDGSVQAYVDGDGSITPADKSDLTKEYVMYMVGSTFWGTEIANGTQTPLWTSPVLGAVLDDVVRFHVLSVGHDHTFHLHAHRWLDEIPADIQGVEANIIDVKKLVGMADSHAFTLKAGTGVGAGMWHLHCHVVSHMESGMAARFRVDKPNASAGNSVAGASPYGAILLGDASKGPGLVTFEISDEPGHWFRSTRGDALAPITITKSLEVMRPGSSAHFVMSDTNAVHTITTLLWPSGADDPLLGNPHNIPFDQTKAYRGGAIVQLDTPGLYVFTCKVHPYMFGAVIVDDDLMADGTVNLGADGALNLGESITLVTGLPVPTASNIALQLLNAFFVVTAPSNWQDFSGGSDANWDVVYPNVPVKVTGGGVVNLHDTLTTYLGNNKNYVTDLGGLHNPMTAGIGEVWIDTQFEKTGGKTKPGTITVLDAATWSVKRKVALPGINMNHPHNIWSNADQSVIYQTQWFDNKLTTIDRLTGEMIDNIQVGDSPSHVMTVPGTDEITVAINGENGIARIPAGGTEVSYWTPTQGPGQVPANPHGHWISSDGNIIVTPNINTGDVGIYDTNTGNIIARPATGINQTAHAPHPIAIGMNKDSIYVTNLLDHSINVFGFDGTQKAQIDLISDYDPLPLAVTVGDGINPLDRIPGDEDGVVSIGVLPIQTPVDPTGRVVVTAHTGAGGTITIIDTDTNQVVKMLPCDPGCHGVNFGAKAGGGYYAYVTSKFSNRVIVVDVDTNNPANSFIAGRILLSDNSAPIDDVAGVTALAGTGGQGIYAVPNVYDGWVQQISSDEWDLSNHSNPVP